MNEKQAKIFVLDTSVIIYDHEAVKQFGKHDVAIPITVLEELDNFKKGNDTKNFFAREFIRYVDKISAEYLLQEWVPINGDGSGRFKVIMSGNGKTDASKVFNEKKPDHEILSAALWLQEEEPSKKVVLVTKDIALRLKAKSLNLNAEDYEAGKIADITSLYTGKTLVEGVASEDIDSLYKQGSMSAEIIPVESRIENHYYILKNGKKSALGFFNKSENRVERIDKHAVYRVEPRNAEQTFAIHALLNPHVKLVTLQGIAGTGKTLLALASALEQRRYFRQIYIARPVVPLSNKDIGYLPGDIKSKLNPYMQPIWDNLKYIRSLFDEKDKDAQRIDEMVAGEKIEVVPLTYIRGRSISNVIIIVDESQNLTPHEVKTIITRAGENTKIIFTGDIYQIDTPYLDAQSNGLSYLIDRLKNQKIFAHVTLQKGERSELANLANELL
ncbi:MAG: PhoH family protein [Bdellovibrionales bacterium]|nr:PhoH family protein [Bdellovibrionales bacterium]